MPKKSIYRQPGAQHFQLVHRSQRDPLINDPEASQRVFVPIGRSNDQGKKNGHTLADLEATLADQLRENEGEASGYGIYYDDSSYDYMQHLKPVGQVGGDSVLLAAPTREKGKGKQQQPEELFKEGLLPDDVLPSSREMTKEEALAQQAAVPMELRGLQPDMDPHLRQVLEALEDDAFVVEEVEEEDDDAWLGELLGGGERQGDVGERFEFAEEGIDEDEIDGGGTSRTQPQLPSDLPLDASLSSRVAAFKAQQRLETQTRPTMTKSEMEGMSEGGDTLGELPPMSVIGGKKRRKGEGSVASGYSMSSSSMVRNKGLTTLDEMFEKVERDYEDDDDFPEDDEVYEPSELGSTTGMSESGASVFSMARSMASRRAGKPSAFNSSSSSTSSNGGFDPSDVIENPPELSRDDMEAIMDDFLEKFEVVGKKMVPILPGESGADKFGVLRRALVGLEIDGEGPTTSSMSKEEADYIRQRFLRVDDEGKKVKEEMPMREIIGKDKDRWDCETILSTYSNVENHPRIISVPKRNNGKQKAALAQSAAPSVQEEDDEESEDGSGSDTEQEGTVGYTKTTPRRPKSESAEDRKLRKAAVKEERASRRKEKKTRQETFGDEKRKQVAVQKRKVGNGGAADAVVGSGRVGMIKL